MKFKFLDFVPVFSGLIGKIALVSSFAMVWSQELGIKNPNFIIENVRIEIFIGSILALIATILYLDAAPAGTLAPLVVLIPGMCSFGVHPLILGILVGIIGFIVIKMGIFRWLVDLAGSTCKASITLTFGLSGIWMATNKLYDFFRNQIQIFWLLCIVLAFTYIILIYLKKTWLMIPIASAVAMTIPYLYGEGYKLSDISLKFNVNPHYWWHDMWEIGYGFEFHTVIRTIPFAFLVILLWTVDTISIQTMREASIAHKDEIGEIDIERSFQIVSLRNLIGVVLGGAQTGSLWRSFLIPLYLVNRPMRTSVILLGIVGIISSLTIVPIQVLSYPPMVWSVLLFGIFIPFAVTAISNIFCEKKVKTKAFILFSTALGIGISPVLSWMSAVIYDKSKNK